jgi:2-dehydropantoate 2-reductase
MKTGIVGAGALGSLFSYYFSRRGIDYTVYEINKDAVNSMKKGLTIFKEGSEEKIVPIIDSTPEILKDSDIIFIFVKSYSTSDAVKTIMPHIKKNSLIVSLQNGIGNFEAISEFINPELIIYGITTHGASKENHSILHFGGRGTIEFGGRSGESVEKLQTLFNNAELDSTVTSTPEKSVWQKALINAGINPIASIMDITNGEILKNGYLKDLQKKILIEGAAAAECAGVKINNEEIIKKTIDVCRNTSSNRCSMLQDIKNKRKTEIDYINGKIIEYADKAGIKVPFNESLYYIIKAIESSFPDSL